ncbi:MAG: excinuclease ABC subunit UvrC [Bacteroidales bacterium]
MNKEILKNTIALLPEKPGIYQFYDQTGKLIYVGKAKNLKKRVSSYFSRISYENKKIQVMVGKVHEIKHIVVPTEHDALLLENNFIKEYQPRYNVLLRDDKTFPWICIKNERFPRVFLTRKIVNDGSSYFGPYTSAQMVRTLLALIRELYSLRTCNLNLSEENIKANKFKVCLEYHLGNCKGPCEEWQTEDDYNQTIDQIRKILKGHISEVMEYLEETMKQMAKEYRFEEAEIIRQKLELLSKFKGKSVIVNPSITNVDVFSILTDGNTSIINFIKVIKGSVIQSHTIEIQKKLEESDAEILALAITNLRTRYNSNAKEIIVPMLPELKIKGVKYTIPKEGDKKKLLDFSHNNALIYKRSKDISSLSQRNIKRKEEIIDQLKKDLHLKEIPVRIECFDNSNLQGTNPVAACVVFINGKPAPKEYRHYHVKTVDHPDDFASMEEIVFRRYKRVLDENHPLPQLIVIDGGKGQINAAIKSLEKLDLHNKIAVIGIAKKLEEIYFPNDPYPIYLDKNSPSLRVIQHIRNEAHRFGITFHRQKRSKIFLHSELDSVKGIGEITKQKLMEKFKSINVIRSLPISKIEEVVGKSKARIIYDYFHKKNQ